MTMPRDRGGYRKIHVNDRVFIWRLGACLEIRLEGNWHNALTLPYDVQWYWRDFPNPMVPPPEPHIVTPGFVRQMIEFGLSQGWNPDQPKDSMALNYQDETFSLASS